MILPIFHNLPCEGWWPESESGPEKKTTNEALNPYHEVLLISCSNNKVISLPSTSMGWWLIEDKTMWNDWNLPVVPQIWQTHNITLTSISLWPKENFVQKPQWHPPNPNSRTSFTTDPLESAKAKCKSTGDCSSAVQLRAALCWLKFSVSSKSPKSQNLSPSTSFVQMNDARRARAWYVDCRLLTAIPWALAVHGPLHLNCGTGMAGQEYKGQRTSKDRSKLSLWGSKTSYYQPQPAPASDSVRLASKQERDLVSC